MRSRTQPGGLALAVMLLPAVAQAFSYAPIADTALHAQADAIVLAQVVEIIDAAQGMPPVTRYRLRVEHRLKGTGAEDPIDVVVPGGRSAHGSFVLSGAPRFTIDQRALIFLRARSDGSYAVLQHALGAFHVRADATGRSVLWRDLRDAKAVSVTKQAAAGDETGQSRDLQRFAAWLSALTQGTHPPADYWLPDDGAGSDLAKYQLSASTPVRWAAFDAGLSVDWYVSSTQPLGLPGGGHGEFQQALDAWNADTASAIRFAYRGTTAATGRLSQADGLNTIQFGDPDDALAGSFDCRTGGVLATTGTWIGRAQTWSGGQFLPLVESDIVVQDGVSCFLGLLNHANAAELFAHELGHALGLAHSCGDNPAPDCRAGTAVDEAVMRPILHADGRGATLGSDDRAGAAYLYPAAAAPSAPQTPATPGDGAGGGPLPLASLTALALLAGLRRRQAVFR